MQFLFFVNRETKEVLSIIPFNDKVCILLYLLFRRIVSELT